MIANVALIYNNLENEAGTISLNNPLTFQVPSSDGGFVVLDNASMAMVFHMLKLGCAECPKMSDVLCCISKAFTKVVEPHKTRSYGQLTAKYYRKSDPYLLVCLSDPVQTMDVDQLMPNDKKRLVNPFRDEMEYENRDFLMNAVSRWQRAPWTKYPLWQVVKMIFEYCKDNNLKTKNDGFQVFDEAKVNAEKVVAAREARQAVSLAKRDREKEAKKLKEKIEDDSLDAAIDLMMGQLKDRINVIKKRSKVKQYFAKLRKMANLKIKLAEDAALAACPETASGMDLVDPGAGAEEDQQEADTIYL